jgi:hypothetical protein
MKNLFLSLAVIATLTVVSCKDKAAETTEATAEGTEMVDSTAAPVEAVEAAAATETVEAAAATATEEVAK